MGWSILHSFWQGASLYIILYGLFLIFYNWSTDTKYKVAYLFQCLIFTSFILTFIKYLNFSSLTSLPQNTPQQQFFIYIEKLQSANWSITKLFPYIVGLYTVGIFVQTLLCMKSFGWLNKIKQTSTKIIPTEWLDLLEDIKDKHKIPSRVTLLISSRIEGPITIGFIKPLIIFPTAYINNISIDEAEAILLHEVAHIKRHDYFFNIILLTIETMLFFNPFIWLVSRHIKIEREQSCDDYVTKYIQNPIIYAKTLLHVELLRNEYKASQALALSGDNKYDLLNRIKRINKQIMETKYTSYKQQLGVILCASLTFIFIAWINPESKETLAYVKQQTIKTSFHEEHILTSTADTIKPKVQNEAKKTKHKIIIDSSSTIRHNDNGLQELKDKLAADNKDLEEIFDSKEWKDNLKSIEAHSKNVVDYFKSPEWKDKIALIEENAKKIEAKFNSPESKEKFAQIEKNAKKIEDFYNSPEFKERIALIEKNAKDLTQLYNSPEYKQKIALIEENAKKLEELYNSPKYKERMESIKENTRKMRIFYENQNNRIDQN
ncbi:MAG: M56 family metallopeptidase [Sphingobacterium composti]